MTEFVCLQGGYFIGTSSFVLVLVGWVIFLAPDSNAQVGKRIHGGQLLPDFQLMKEEREMNYMRRRLSLAAAAITVIAGFGCGSTESDIQKDLDTNPKFKEKGITATLHGSDNGYYTITVKGFSPKLTEAINKGEDFGVIAMFTSTNIMLLAEMEQILKKRPEVKGIKWKAE